MPYLNLVYMNHLDLTWRRPRYTAGKTAGWRIAPYGELQERQVEAGLAFIRDGGCFDIEQTVTLREFLERNPDAEGEVREAVKNGSLTLLGGGESVTDTNLPDGESLIRNHVYSLRWMREEFGVTPALASLPDAFGLSGGLPTLYRALGYRGMLQYHRVFQGNRPFWRGVSGDVVALDSAKPGADLWLGTCVKTRVCGICGGSGCASCSGSGMELLEVPETPGSLDGLAGALKHLAEEGGGTLLIGGEESMACEGTLPKLRELAADAGLTVRCISAEKLALEKHADLLNRADCANEDEIDPRAEGNPVASGCYTTRIKLKQEYRSCESALRCGERLCAAASLVGLPYPAKTFERAWRKLAFLGFHDALPASHSDDAYEELTETARQLKVSVSRLTEKAEKTLIRRAMTAETAQSGGKSPEKSGIPFLVFNPLEFPVKNARLTGALSLDRAVCGGTVIAPDGKERPLLSLRHSVLPESSAAEAEFLGDLPAFGYGVFRFVPSDPDEEEQTETVEPKRGAVLENGRLRVEFGAYSVKRITDLVTGDVLAEEGTFSPVLTDDAGHPWGRTNTIQYHERADEGGYCENMLPARVFERKLTIEKTAGMQTAVLTVRYSREEKQLHLLTWEARFVLPDDSDELRVRIRTTFDAKDLKLSTQVVLPEKPKDGKLRYEIPLGEIDRGAAAEFDSQLGYADEWPALRYVKAESDGGRRVILCNRGTPAHSLDGNTIRVSLLRTPTQLCCGFGIENAIDPSEHVFDFTLSAERAPSDAYRRGMTLNTFFPAIRLSGEEAARLPETGKLPAPMEIPDSLPLSALKAAEDGDGWIVRYLGADEPEKLKFARPAVPVTLLEDDCGGALTEAEVGKYALASYRIR